MICPNQEEEMKDLELQRTNSEINGRRRWKSCCFYVDRDVVVFSTKYFILIALMTFFSAELHLSTTCEDKNLYQSLLMLTLGISVPNPRLK